MHLSIFLVQIFRCQFRNFDTNFEILLFFQVLRFVVLQYNAIAIGESGNGGNYVTQIGFGWTNGLNMILLHLYGNKVKSDDFNDFKPAKEPEECSLLSRS